MNHLSMSDRASSTNQCRTNAEYIILTRSRANEQKYRSILDISSLCVSLCLCGSNSSRA
ncbi:MAG: hypothetical protein AAGA60_08295 [Cyanobacteria bacterium P01_E01_bin.42]